MGLLDIFKKTANTVASVVKPLSPFATIIESAYQEVYGTAHPAWNWKATDSKVYQQQILTLNDKEKIAFILEAITTQHTLAEGKMTWGSHDKDWNIRNLWGNFMNHLLKTKLEMNDEDYVLVLESFMRYKPYGHSDDIMQWPVTIVVSKIEKYLHDRKPSADLITALNRLEKKVDTGHYYDQKARAKLVERIKAIVFAGENDADTIRPVLFPAKDQFATYANDALQRMPQAQQPYWYQLMAHTQKASGGSPTKKFLDQGKDLFKELGADNFKQVVNDWLQFITAMKEIEINTYTIEFIATANTDMVKGLIWLCSHFHDKTTLFNLAALAERSYRKVPGKGPLAPSIGNACVYALANSKGLDGVGHLSRLRLRIKQNSTQNLIEKYLLTAAAKQGVSIHEIEDMAVDDFDLTDGSRTYMFDDYKAVLSIIGIGKTELSWFKPDGSPQKSVPAVVKEKHAARLKKIKDVSKQIELTTSAQRDRIDRLMKSERTLSWQQFNEYYFEHGLMCYIAKQLIWTFIDGEQKHHAIWHNNAWTNPAGTVAFSPSDNTRVALWHPVFHTLESIQQWRTFLLDKQLTQPLKQAFREVYLLTDAEINTVTYSNRMAAHILKQHQFNSLAKTRGWKYNLMGAYDNGIDNDKASIHLQEYGLRAEFWINEVNSDDAFNDTGIWLYVATDQVRFVQLDNNEVVQLLDVPALLFSEVMRDVDLFVGVASVGNDPLWRDNGGLTQYRDYWTAYSFGDLTEIAKTRKMMLERLLPRLKINKVAAIKDKFLVVQGKLRTYKIHLGSTNILMEPNDQYLCIVPDRSAKPATENLMLGFEGDNGLSVILSKAFLLADDDKITDTTITSQINRR